MEQEQEYGYLLNQENYDNIKPSPNLNGDIPEAGYNFRASNYLCSKMAQQKPDCGFIDTFKLLKQKTSEDADNYMLEQIWHQNLVSGEIPIHPKSNQSPFLLLDMFLNLLRVTLPSHDIPLQRFVANLTINSEQKEPHGVALCIDTDKTKQVLNVIILEQHAQSEGTPKYNPTLDYSTEIDLTLKHIQNYFKNASNTQNFTSNIFQNDKPICRERHVCGIVSAEVCRQLLQADNPMELSKSGRIKLNAIQVQALHQENVHNYQNDSTLRQARANNSSMRK